jgi:hypothetical protein
MRKNIRIIGVDYDHGYIQSAKEHIRAASIENCIRVYHQDVYQMDQLKGRIVLPHGSSVGFEGHQEDVKFDAIIMSGTFSVLQDRVGVLKLLMNSWAKPNCKVMIAQAYQRTTPPMARLFKWSLKFWTTVDHGQLITLNEAEELFAKDLPKECNLLLVEMDIIEDSIDNALEGAYLTILERKNAE